MYKCKSYLVLHTLTLQSDFGSPMVCDRDGTMVMAGFNSAITRGCEPDERTLYSRVSAVSEWIRTVIQS